MNTTLGNEEFVALVEKYRHEFHRYIVRTLWSTHNVEDVFAEAVLSAYENLAQFRKGTNFRAWMFRIITNKCFVANRHTARTPQPIDDTPERYLTTAQQTAGYAEVLDAPERVLEALGGEVYTAFQKLSEKEQACLMLRAVEEFSYKEIAEILEIPVGTVMTHLARGRAKLRKDLTRYAHETGVISGK